MKRDVIKFVLAIVLCAFFSASSQAVDHYWMDPGQAGNAWNNAAGNWGTPAYAALTTYPTSSADAALIYKAKECVIGTDMVGATKAVAGGVYVGGGIASSNAFLTIKGEALFTSLNLGWLAAGTNSRGKLRIDPGAVVTAPTLIIGHTGTATYSTVGDVNMMGGILNVSTSLYFGDATYGNGEMTMNGGTLNYTGTGGVFLIASYAATSKGKLTVNSGAVINSASNTHVGRAGSGELIINGSGKVKITGAATMFQVGSLAGSTGSMTMNGGILDTAGHVYIGTLTSNANFVQLNNDANVTVGGQLRIALDGATSVGRLTIAGSAAQMKVAGAIGVGFDGGTGSAKIELQAGTLTGLSTLTINSDGTINITGGTLILPIAQLTVVNSYIDSNNIYTGSGRALEVATTATQVIVTACTQADRNGDCVVNLEDLRLFAQDWLIGSDFHDFALLAKEWAEQGNVYYVSNDGNDNNPGIFDLPFRTIQKAANIAKRDDTIYVRAGLYRETVIPANSGIECHPIRFEAYPGEEPVISGADIFNPSWQVHSGSIYKADCTYEFEQLFVDGQMMNEARWPNTPVDDLVHMVRAKSDSGTSSSVLVDNALPSGNWNGAYVRIAPGGGWISFTKTIKDYLPGNRFSFTNATWDSGYTPTVDNFYWLFGSLVGLDSATEWFLDSAGNKLYIWCPGNVDPSTHLVERKQRKWAFDLFTKNYVEMKGFKIFGAGIRMTGSHCLVDDCHIKYAEHFRFNDGYDNGANVNHLAGSYNEWRNSSVVYSAGNGIYDEGSYNKITNCIIHDVDYMASALSNIRSTAYQSEYSYNTLFNSGRNIIYHLGARAIKILHNNMYYSGLLTSDMGLTYTWGNDGEGTVIAYNHAHDNLGSGSGIYLDNYSSNYIVHHNLVWNVSGDAIQLNSPSLNNLIYNNTLMQNCALAFGYYAYPGETPDQRGTKVKNNLIKATAQFVTGANAPEVAYNGNYSIYTTGWPSTGSGAINAGTIIPGYTDGYVGSAPDIGCYETGTSGWQAGADWSVSPWD